MQHNVPARVVFMQANFADGRQPAYTADLMFPMPWRQHSLAAVGLGLELAGSPPWEVGQNLPGIAFGAAVAASLPRRVREEVLAGSGGYAFTEAQVADFLRPVLDAVARGDCILAGVSPPPSADPVFVRMSPIVMRHWRFLAGVDKAEPQFAGGVEYIALRIFTPMEFRFVEQCGGRLRPLPTDRGTLETSTPHAASGSREEAWMESHVTAPGDWKMEQAISACMSETGSTYRKAKAAWKARPDHIRGARGRHKG